APITAHPGQTVQRWHEAIDLQRVAVRVMVVGEHVDGDLAVDRHRGRIVAHHGRPAVQVEDAALESVTPGEPGVAQHRLHRRPETHDQAGLVDGAVGPVGEVLRHDGIGHAVGGAVIAIVGDEVDHHRRRYTRPFGTGRNGLAADAVGLHPGVRHRHAGTGARIGIFQRLAVIDHDVETAGHQVVAGEDLVHGRIMVLVGLGHVLEGDVDGGVLL